MAYARYSRKCDWYIFWYTQANAAPGASAEPARKEEEMLAVWHADHRADGPTYSYTQVREMLATGDLSRIPGYTARDRQFLIDGLSKFVSDVDQEWEDGATSP